MSRLKVIKRYANRKLYDTDRSCYVTLDDIAHLIRSGEDVAVIDNKSGEDLTQVTLAQIIFEAEKRRSFMSLSLLRELIQEGGDALGDLARGGVQRAQTKAHEVRQTAQKLRHGLEGRLDRVIGTPAGATCGLTELIERTRRNVDELQEGVAIALRGPAGTRSRFASLGRDMEEIRTRLADLEKRLAELPRRA